jgi:hypothetical protein
MLEAQNSCWLPFKGWFISCEKLCSKIEGLLAVCYLLFPSMLVRVICTVPRSEVERNGSIT